jgi:hypothetical protein
MNSEEDNIDKFITTNFPSDKIGFNFDHFANMYVVSRTMYNEALAKQSNLPNEQETINAMKNGPLKQKAQQELNSKKLFISQEIEQHKKNLIKYHEQIAPIQELSATFKSKHPDTIIDTLIPVYYKIGNENFIDLRRQLNLKIMEDGSAYKPLKEEHYLQLHTYYQNPEYKRVRQSKNKNPDKQVIKGP